MTPRRTITSIALLVVGLVTGCAASEPKPTPQPSWAVGTPRDTVVAIADDLRDAYLAAYPDLTLTPEDQILDPRSSDCSGKPAPTGERVVWRSSWTLRVEPKQDTVPLLGKVVDELVDDGWVLRDHPGPGEGLEELDRDGYYLAVAGYYDEDSTYPARISFTAYSPCVDNTDK